VYVLELGGEDDAFAAREAAAVCSGVEPLATGLATARGVPARATGLAFTRAASRLLGTCEPTVADAERLLRAAGDAPAAPTRGETVAVRARDVRGSTGVDTPAAERALGAILTDRGHAVDLEDPDRELRALFAAGRGEAPGVCALGWLARERTGGFGARAPTEKPFFQPGSMGPLLARALAHVAGAAPGRTVADPMCGTGGVLVEAGLVGARVVGVDAQRKMVRGARENLTRYLDGGFAVARGDATRPPLRADAVDGVVFDAPYGRQSKVASRSVERLVGGALAAARDLAPRAVVVGDRSWARAARDRGWTVESTFERRVHRSLVRHVHVLDRR
jgi:tRNA (guanine10-N2)-dimethyltransferase